MKAILAALIVVSALAGAATSASAFDSKKRLLSTLQWPADRAPSEPEAVASDSGS
jgi:hypothetical protein